MNDQTPPLIDSFLVRLAGARVAILFAFHAVVFAACYAFAYLLRFEFAIPKEFNETFRWSLPVVLGVQLLIGIVFGFYRGWWRYVGMADVVRLVFGLSAALALLLSLWYVGGLFGIEPRFLKSPRGVLLIDWAFSLLSLFGIRVLIRLGRDRFRPVESESADHKRVLIIGAGDAGETLAREIEHRPQLGMKVVGFVDDHRVKWGSQIRGIRVYGPIAEIGNVADETGANEAFIAIPSASGKRIREVIQCLAGADLKFKTIPGLDQLVTGRVQVTQLRPVNVEDLIRRDSIDLPGDPVRELFRGKRVLITGAGGTIGSELASQVLQFEPESVALVERSEYALYDVRKRLTREVGWVKARISSNLMDICDSDVLETLIAREQPHIVLHAAAHKHVPLGEENALEYLRNNALATRELAELCIKHDVPRFVFISTDKAINPASVMGASKRVAEILLLDAIRDTSMKMTIVRFGNVIGSSGSVIPLFMEQIAAGGPITVTHPSVTRYFIRTSEAISLVLQAATLGDGGRVFMLDMGEPLKIVDLARDLVRLSSHSESDIQIVYTGLRPGEKLFEEIRLEGESIYPTVHPQIVITEAPQPDPTRISHWLHRASTSTGDPAEVRRLINDLVCEFQMSVEEPVQHSATMNAKAVLA
ncbi:MAG TPA: nucleoside-diphosphate sugar epimerase/dehydratase [Thermoanaerobaculia bacterium]|nr:nucleoside-diphosphate sugar epimerase/dehydratase [Thermoanaerobaculia bacterium]